MLLLGALSASCKTSTEDERRAETGEAKPPAKIGLQCKAVGEADSAQRQAVEGAARSAYETLMRSDFDAMWSMLHPQAQRGQGKEPIVEALRSMRARLGDATAEPKLEWAYTVGVDGGANDLARVQCGPEGEMESLTMMANAGGEDLAVASLWTPGMPYSYTTTVTLRKRGPSWRLVGVHVSPSAYRGKTAADFFRVAEQFDERGRSVTAFLALGVARTLSGRGSSVTTVLRERIDQNLDALEKSPGYTKELGTWTVDDRSYVVHGFGLAATQSDLSVVVQYVTPGGLVRETLEQEADQLIAHMRTRYPELRGLFDAVVFEAYREAPTEKDAEYDAYRIARYLDPSRAVAAKDAPQPSADGKTADQAG
jgi:hypothetical protein